MADKNLTIFQRLERALSNSWSSEQGSIPHINSYDITGDKSVLYKTKDKGDYEKTKLELQQNNYLKNRWVKANVNLSVGAFAGLSNIKLMYRDAELMDAFPEIGAALDLVSEESCLTGDKGQIVNVYSKSDRIKAILEDLFVNRLNLQVTAPMVIRGMCKYGNQFQLLDIDRTLGVKGWRQLPVFNVDRIEGGVQNPYGTAQTALINASSTDKVDMSTKFVWTEENNSQVPFRDWQIAHFRLLTNSMYLPYGCLVGDTRVETEFGYKDIDSINAGDNVWTFNVETQRRELGTVSVNQCKGIKEVFRVRTKHFEIEGTADHKLLTCSDGVLEYKEIKDIAVGDLLVCNNAEKAQTRQIGVDKSIPTDAGNKTSLWEEAMEHVPNEVNEDFARLFGFMLGDGWLDGENRVMFAMGEYEALNKRYSELIGKFSGRDVKYVESKENKSIPYDTCYVNSKPLKTIFERLGFKGDCYTKRIPAWVFMCSAPIKKAFLKGMVDADGALRIVGSDSLSNTVELTNEQLVRDVKTLAQSLGYKCGNISERDRIGYTSYAKDGSPIVSKHKSYYVTFYEKQNLQEKKTDMKNRLSDEFKLEKVTEITNEGEKKTYDITIIGNENSNFFANGIVTHNCSYLNSARRHFRMLSLMEDMMLIYRLERSIERRVFKIYVGNIDDADVSAYIEEIANNFKRTPIIDPMTGQIDLRKNIMPVHKDTPIPLMDGRTIPIKELAKEYEEGKINFVYSVQDKTHQIVPGKVVWCGKNYTADKLVKITLDDGSYSIMAPEHEVVMRDGTKKRADNLQSGESVMPFYRKNAPIAKGCVSEYETVYNPHSGKYEFTHRLVGQSIPKGNPRANVIHHVNFDRLDNTPYNLRWMTWKEHSAYHTSLNSDAKIKELRSKSTSAAWMDEEKRKKHIRNITTVFDEHVWNAIDNEVAKGVISTQNMLIDFINRNLMDYLLEHNSTGKLHHYKKITKPLFKARLNERGFKNITEYFAYMEANVDGLDITRAQSRRRSDRAKSLNIWKNLQSIKTDTVSIDEHLWEGVRHEILKGGIKGENDIVAYTRSSKNAVRAYIREQYGNVTTVDYISAMKKNHKVAKTEWVEGDDVYCMTVLGLFGEEDRHNFAVRTWAADGSVSDGGMFVSNCVDQDFFIPVRTQDAPNPIETLPAAQNLTAMDDIKFVQNKVLTALRIPKTFLNFEEAAGEGKNLALMDIRFTRVINRIQQAFLMELTKIASIHLYLLGFEDDLTNFNLTMNNPSTQAEQLEIENLQKKISAVRDAVSDPGNGLPVMSLTRALKQIMKFTDNEIKENLEEIRLEKGIAAELEKTAQIIKRTGLFDNVDRMYGEPGAEYIEDAQQGGPEGGMPVGGGGGGFGGGLDSLGAPGMDDTGDISGAEGAEPTMDMGGGGNAPTGADSTPQSSDTGNTANEGILKPHKPLLTEGRRIAPLPINKASEGNLLEAYISKLNARSEDKLNEDRVVTERSAIYDKALLINEEFNKMIKSLNEIEHDNDGVD